MHATKPVPYRRHRADDTYADVAVDLCLSQGGCAVSVVERGDRTAGVVFYAAEGVALARSVNAGDGTWAVLADWIEEHAGGCVLPVWPYRDDAAELVAAALRRCG